MRFCERIIALVFALGLLVAGALHANAQSYEAALAGFTSYSVGHNVGASVFTGGAVRYRIYSAHGLSAIEVAKLCFVAGLTFWQIGRAHV